jgi:Leucine Rich Repeat (LRR) protein
MTHFPRRCALGGVGAKALCAAVGSAEAELTTLNLRDNNLGDAGLYAYAQYSAVVTLSLSDRVDSLHAVDSSTCPDYCGRITLAREHGSYTTLSSARALS